MLSLQEAKIIKVAGDRYLSNNLPNYFYHYTSLDGALGILSSKSLWLSNARFLNDTTEISGGLNILWHALSDIPEISDIDLVKVIQNNFFKWSSQIQAYVASFSEFKDNLQLWKFYGDDGKGLCLAYETKEIAAFLNYRLPSSTYRASQELDAIPSSYAKILYGYDNKVEMMKSLVKGIIKEIVSSNVRITEVLAKGVFTEFLRYIAALKDKSFEHEMEWRIFEFRDHSDFSWQHVNFRNKGGWIQPYLKSLSGSFSYQVNDKIKYITPCEVIIGPNCILDKDAFALDMLLASAGAEKYSISKSEINYRN
jgi:hypothetical protein